MTANPETHLPADAKDFLRRFRRGLSSLPTDVREEIVAEVSSHLLDRIAQGHASPLAQFGSPEDYASSFVAETSLSAAVSQGGLNVGRAVLDAVRGTVWVFAAVPLLLVQLFALATMLVGVVKPFKPETTGLFANAQGEITGFGWMSTSNGVHEVLGYWVVPLAIVIGSLLLWLSQKALWHLARWRLQAVRNSRAN